MEEQEGEDVPGLVVELEEVEAVGGGQGAGGVEREEEEPQQPGQEGERFNFAEFLQSAVPCPEIGPRLR